MRQFILGLPKDLLDAGRVDGAGELRIFFRIILPLCGPALATLGILTFLGSWNKLPLAARRGPDRGPLHPARRAGPLLHRPEQHELRAAARRHRRDHPILVVFLIFQKRFIEGIATTGLK